MIKVPSKAMFDFGYDFTRDTRKAAGAIFGPTARAINFAQI